MPMALEKPFQVRPLASLRHSSRFGEVARQACLGQALRLVQGHFHALTEMGGNDSVAGHVSPPDCKSRESPLLRGSFASAGGMGGLEPRGPRDDQSRWRPPLKIRIIFDRLLTGFAAPVEQVMYLDKSLRGHDLLRPIARTNRPLPSMKKLAGIVVDYFGIFANLDKALNFYKSVHEEFLID